MDTVHESTPRTITPPDGFPVSWDQPGDADFTWTTEDVHFPVQVTSLDGDYLRLLMAEGFLAAAQYLDLPIQFAARRINTYHYMALIPITTDMDALQAIEDRTERTLTAAVMSLESTWREDYLPEIQRFIAEWETFDLSGASLPALLAHFDTTIANHRRLTEIHFLSTIVALLAISLFAEFFGELWGNHDAFAAHKLLQGFDNKTLESDRALWHLAHMVSASSTVRHTLENARPIDALAALEDSIEGRAFLAELHAYLERYGKRSNVPHLLSTTPLIDDPTPVLDMIRVYAAQPVRDFEEDLTKLSAEREAALAVARERLVRYPREVGDQFEGMLRAAQAAVVIQEDHAFWIDFRSSYEMRRVIIELGRRLADAGRLDNANDVVYLTFDEIHRAAGDGQTNSYQSVISERQAEMAHFATIQRPMMLGTEPAGPMPDNPISRALDGFFGAPPTPMAEPGVLNGNAGSAGMVRGTAKVIHSLAEASKLQPGDVLVAPTTSPPWTPLFATVAAVVTDTGGILSHCAVVAREFMIPAVVGVGNATQVIHDGQLLEVDGSSGTVRILG